ncbi:hypothetical protein IEQ34_004152 [Dendrobium chrysotoxum]|uniref:Uncharacterized protein n=1 Tax=Dendrobium chrysotoxum TaxID=161865 RepID=A0AAV7HFK8_DENCH|nr:hypothetical protein IEQ34_004152 [Dendrobium chrysotoxum]
MSSFSGFDADEKAMNGCDKSISAVHRLLGSFTRQHRRKSFPSSDIVGGISGSSSSDPILISRPQIPISDCSVQCHGDRPEIISTAVHPNAQISAAALYSFLVTDSGAMYNGVPLISTENSSTIFLASPKSAIFASPSTINMF